MHKQHNMKSWSFVFAKTFVWSICPFALSWLTKRNLSRQNGNPWSGNRLGSPSLRHLLLDVIEGVLPGRQHSNRWWRPNARIGPCSRPIEEPQHGMREEIARFEALSGPVICKEKIGQRKGRPHSLGTCAGVLQEELRGAEKIEPHNGPHSGPTLFLKSSRLP